MKRALWKRSMAIALSIIIMFSGNQTAFSMETGSTNEPAAVQEQEDRDDGIVTETASDAEEGNAEAEEMQASEEADQGDSDADQPPGSEEEAGSEIEDASGESGVSSYADSSEEAAAADSTQETVSDEDAAADSTQEAAPEEEPDGTQETVSDEDAAADSTQEAAPEEEPENAALGMTGQDTAPVMPAQKFRAESDGGIIVEAEVDEGVLPENTVIKVEDITKKEAMDVAQDQSEGLEGQEVKDAVGVNITFLDAEGNEIQPADDSKVRVKISLPKEQKLDKEEAEDKESAFAVLHVDEKGEVTEVEDAEADVNGAEFDAEAFSVYVIASYTLETYFRSFSGENYKITVEFDDTAEIPVGSELYVTEILPDTEEYKGYLSDTRAAMDIEELYQITFARYFDIEIRNDGEKVEPKKPVKVKIEYADAMERSGDDTFSIIHFAEDGTEVISDVQVSSDNKEIVYEQNSFSVTGTIISGNPSHGTTYAVVVKDNATGKYYAVQNDGRLAEVEYREENNTAYVTLDYPYMWTYESAHDEIADDGTNHEYDEEAGNAPYNIRVHADARGYNGLQLPEGIYFRYISPVSDNGIEEETKEQPSHNDFKRRNLIAYENHTVHGVDWYNNNTGKYIGADFENLHITGNESSGNAVPVYLARIESVPGVGGDHETVSHIDIAIYGKGYLDVPLAYGTYYDENGGEVLTVTADNNVTLKLEKDIDITKEDMMRASLEARDGDGNELSDAFYITGYSSNQQTDHSAVQVRMEGSFKVSTLGDYTGSFSHPNQDEEWCTRRLANQVYYRVSTIKDVPFELIYNGQQLYDKNGRALSVTSKCNLTAGFSYWDKDNECPPVLSDFEQKYHLYDGVPAPYSNQGRNNYLWSHGAIIDNTWNYPYYRGDSGMDFVLGNKEDSQNKVVAVEIVKMIVDEDGNRISPSKDVKNDFTLYYNKDESGDSQRSIHDYAISPDRASADEVKDLYEGYDDVRTEEIVVGSDGIGSIYDYQVEPGMFYVKEDAGKMGENGENSQITDTDGNTWTYKETYVETEYVWRNNEHNGGYHVAEGYSSVPEILGEYFDDNGNSQRNGFLEFYVYNVYEKPEPHKKEVTPYEGTGVLGPVQVGDEITYEISYKNYKTEAADVKIKDTLDPNVKYISSSPEGRLTGGPNAGGTVNWTIPNVPAGTEGSVTLTVKVLEGALQSKGGEGKVVNGGDSTTVKVGNDKEYSVEVVENPVPEPPHKKETAPYEGTGVLGAVKVGDEITYEISYRNYKSDKADVVIKDTLDPNVKYISSSPEGRLTGGPNAGGTVNWTIPNVPAGTEGSVTLTVKVLEGALQSKGGEGKVVNGGDSTTVKVGNDKEYSVEVVENPVPEPPHKKETEPYEGTGTLGPVKVGDEITYEISYKNYKTEAADVKIKDTLDPNVKYISSSPEGQLTGGPDAGGTVNWTIPNVPAGTEGSVTLTVKVLEGALQSKGGEGKVVNGGDSTTVKVGNDKEYSVEVVENPVPEPPHKKETEPYEGTGTLGPVKVGDEITYEITYINYKDTEAAVTIKDKLDPNVKYISSSPEGQLTGGPDAGGTVNWTIPNVPAGTEGSVTLTVKVLEGALQSKGGEGKVVNGGDSTTVKVGNDQEYSVESVENPVPEPPVKKETAPYEGTGVLGPVKVGDRITYEISYKNYKTEAADVKIKDKLDPNVKYISSSPEGQLTGGPDAGGTVNWTIPNVPAGTEGSVTLTVEVLEGALQSKGGEGEVVNGGDSTTVQVGNDKEYSVEVVENPVPEPPHKKETKPYEGTGTLGPVKVGDEITYEITYINYKDTEAAVTIKDKLDPNVKYISSSPEGQLTGGPDAGGTVNWTIPNVPAGTEGSVTLTVKVLEGALQSKGGEGKVVNGGDSTTVKVGNDKEYSVEVVENPVPEPPHKKETEPYEGTGTLGPVKVGDEITYEISYKNYKSDKADVVIKDTLDPNVKYISSSPEGQLTGGPNAGGTVNWTIPNVPAGTEGSVTLTVKVLEGALQSKGGKGKVVNGGDSTTVKVGNDKEYSVESVENPVPEPPVKKETAPYEGTGELGAVKVGDEITYEISYRNYKSDTADVVIKDTLDPNVEFVSASDDGAYDKDAHVVNWTVKDVEAGKNGTVTLKVKVLEGALQSEGGEGEVVNGGHGTTVKVGNDNEYDVNTVTNPVPEEPHKKEIDPYVGTGVLGAVKVGDEITYEISYRNYKKDTADVTIKDTLDPNVEFVSASDGGAKTGAAVYWTIKDVEAGKEGTVTLTVRVLEGALQSKGGEGKVVNGGDSTTVKVGNDQEYSVESVENPVPEPPVKKETAPYKGTGELGAVKVGDEITYEISYRNYKSDKADVVIKDTLDPNVEFVSASDGGTYDEDAHVVNWTVKDVEAGKNGTVTLKVKVLEGALQSVGGEGEVVNGGHGTTVKVGNDKEYDVNTVTNPVPEEPHKKEIAPYLGTGVLGAVKVGDEITYEISYRNYKKDTADVTIKDTLDPNVEFVNASDGGTYDEDAHVVNWTVKDVEAGKEGTVTLTVRVLEGALQSKGGEGKVVNGGDSTTVKVGNDQEYSVEVVENPVPEPPVKKETAPYEGTGELGAVKVGDEITYEISYRNYKSDTADVVIKDTLDPNVEFVSASDGGTYDEDAHVVNWTVAEVEAGKEGTVTLTVKVLEGALQSVGGEGEVVNGGHGTTVKVGNDKEYDVNTVTNPVPEEPHKKEIDPYEGTGVLGAVKVGDEITYEISYKNYKKDTADVTIKDTLDPNVEFVSASDGGKLESGVVNWTVKDVEAGKEGTVTLTVKVLEGALQSKGGEGKVVNGGDSTTVKVGNDQEYSVEVVENPVPEPPVKKETAPYEGTGELGAVKVGDEITYEISYRNYKSDKADVVIKDTLDKNVEFVSASDGGAKTGEAVFWTIKDVPAGEEGSVTLTVKVLEGALESNGGKGKVENGPGTTVKVGNDSEFEVETVTNPVPENPHKQEIAPYLGTGTLGEVEVGDEITYEISYKNYKSEAADVIIKDTLDKNVEFVSASNGGKLADGVVNWTIADVPAGTEGTVTLKVIVLEGARKSNSGPGKVVNGGDTTTVKVGNDAEYSVETVENPVPEEPAPEKPHKREITPYEGNGTLGEVKVGDQITYEISYKNYKRKAVDIVIKDTLDKNVEYVSSSDGGKLQDGVVIWTLKEVEAGKEGTVTLTVKVLSGALKANGGPGKVVNGGKNATVKVGDDPEFTLEVVENPVTKPGKPGEPPRKTRTGDENPVALYALLFAAAGGGLAVLLWRRRRRQE